MTAIERQGVTAFAPHLLVIEFLKVSADKRSRRSGADVIEVDEVEDQIERFLQLTRDINFIRETEIQAEAWRLMKEEAISPPDSWMLACAISVPEAEPWVSHEHRDGFVSAARRNHANVFTLVGDSGRIP